MFNMIKLDWLGMKYYWCRIIIVPIVICFIGLIYSEAIIIPVIAYVMLSFSVNPFAVEEKGKLDNLYLTLPVSRKTIVSSRFGLSLIMQAGGLIIGAVVTLVLSELLYGRSFIGIKHTFRADFSTVFLIICGSLLFYSIMNLSMFPVLFKIGYAKGKALGFYIPIVVSMVIVYGVILSREFNEAFSRRFNLALDWVVNNSVLAAVIMLIAAVLVVAVSYLLSHRVYAKREF